MVSSDEVIVHAVNCTIDLSATPVIYSNCWSRLQQGFTKPIHTHDYTRICLDKCMIFYVCTLSSETQVFKPHAKLQTQPQATEIRIFVHALIQSWVLCSEALEFTEFEE